MTKQCSACNEAKPPSSFGRDKSRRDGLNVYCRLCANSKSVAYSKANPERIRAIKAKSQAANIDRYVEWRVQNGAKLREYWVKYGKRYRTERRAETCAKARRQQAARRNAVPLWFDKELEQAVYREAERRRLAGEDVEVDHIVPIISPFVCGLHWHGNLRIVSTAINRAKSNRLIEELAVSP